MTDLSIIIPTLDPDMEFGWEDKLARADVEGELLVCTEGSASEARNKGIRAAEADKLVFLDDDSVPQGDYFDRVAELLEEHPAVTGRIRDTGSSITRGVSGQYDQGDTGHVTETVVSCNMALRREVFETVGGFDERLPYGHEETELIDRVTDQYAVWYSPDMVVEHPFAESVSDYLEKQYRHGKEAIPYFDITNADVRKKIAKFLLIPTYYIDSTVSKSLISGMGQVVYNIGLIHGYLTYEGLEGRS